MSQPRFPSAGDYMEAIQSPRACFTVADLRRSQPVIGGSGGSGIEDVPTAGCWTFRVLWGAHNEHSSTINLEVLPAGTLPPN